MEEYSNSNSSKPPRNRMNLEKGVVGLGIVAAMSMSTTDVVSSAKPAANFRGTTTYSIFYASPLILNIGTPHFLSSCNLCHKHLHGLDIFIYRGEKAFCSAECRETHISNSNDLDNCRSRVVVHNPLRLTSAILAA